MKDIFAYVLKEPRCQLWGVPKKAESFYRISALLTIYHDLYGTGASELWYLTKAWYPASHNTLMHNFGVMRHELARWGKANIVLGNLNDWRAVARTMKVNKKEVSVDLKVDSTDMKKEGFFPLLLSFSWFSTPTRKAENLQKRSGVVLQRKCPGSALPMLSGLPASYPLVRRRLLAQDPRKRVAASSPT